MRRTAALILGGGPAGAAAAIALRRLGLTPLVLERNRETGDSLCGGFLSWHTLATLERLGLARLPGRAVERVRVFTARTSAEARLPRPAIGLSRRMLDKALLDHAAEIGAAVERGVAAREASGTTLRLDDGSAIEGEALLLATGKHDLRGLARPHDEADPALGLRVRLGPACALDRLVGPAIELHLFDRGYAGLLLQEDGTANLCLAVRKSRLADAGGRPEALLEAIGRELPSLGERLAWKQDGAAIDAVGAVPYGWRARSTAPGVFRLGDQAGVMPSLAGEGIGIALASGLLAAEALACGGPAAAADYQRRMNARLARPIGIADALLRLGERPALARPAVRLLGLAPGLARLLARATRVPT